jgi:hypothetical protein
MLAVEVEVAVLPRGRMEELVVEVKVERCGMVLMPIGAAEAAAVVLMVEVVPAAQE